MNVSILAVRPFLELVAEQGLCREEFLSASGIEPARLDDVDGTMKVSELDRLQEAALTMTGDPALGLHLAERATPPAYDVMGHLPSHTATLRETIESLLRFSRILSDVTAKLEEHGEEAMITFRFVGPPDSSAVRFRAEMTVTGFTRVIQTFCGRSAMPREVLFQHAAPPYRDEYTRLFGGLERFEQPVTAIRFDATMLGRAGMHSSPRLKAIFTNEAERMLRSLDQPKMYSDRVRDWLETRGTGAPATMEEAANELGISVRSLRRRLAEEGVSYPKLVEDARVAFAKKLLEDPGRSIYEVAFAMGFSDPSAFHRAFRRWTGMTPTEYRETNR